MAISVHCCQFRIWDYEPYFYFKKQQFPVNKLYLPTRNIIVGDGRLELPTSAV
jgi:hypothetical protein